MIQRSILVCAAVILAWHLLMPRIPRKFFTIPGMERSNYFRAQGFVHDTAADAKKVIVGSSMSDRLSAGEGFDKLTFPAGGPFTGLELIRATGRRPPVVWIESNMILRDPEANLLADVLSPWRRLTREASPVFMEAGRPSNHGVGVFEASVRKGCKLGSRLTGSPAERDGAWVLDQAVMDGVMAVYRAQLSKVPDGDDLAKRVARMAEYADELTGAGCKVVFFELPIDESLKELAEPAAIRKAMKERFPSDHYHWLDLSRDTPYEMADGVHLVPAEADFVVRRMLDFENTLK